MKSSVKVSFWLNSSKKNKDGLSPIYLRVRLHSELFNKSTGINIKRADWDSKQMKARGSTNEIKAYNNHLEGIRIKIMQLVTQLNIQGADYSVRTIKKLFEGETEKKLTLMEVYDEHLHMMSKMIGKQYTKSTVIKYKNTRLRLSQFLKSKHKRNDINLLELTSKFMHDFDFFLRDKFDNSTTTVYKHYQRFTRVLNIAMQNGHLDRYPFPTYKIRMPKKQIEYLDMDQIERLERAEFHVNRLEVIRDIFLFATYTGLGYKELEGVTPDDVTTGMDGEIWINILRQKTQKHYQVPLFPKAQEIIQKYTKHPRCIKTGKLLPVPSNVKYNAYLKEIATIAGIKMNLTSHIARKSFATTIMLANGVNIGVVSRLLGHSDVRVTLDAYGAFNDQLMMSDVGMMRDRFTTKMKMVDKSSTDSK